MSSNTEHNIACDLTALTPEQREHHMTKSPLLLAAVQEIRELPDGYSLRLPASSDTLVKIADYITHERLCCSFFNFGVTVEPYGGPIWFHLSGEEGVKELIRTEMGAYLPEAVATAAGMKA
jgi:hypothetical protein